jgi:hypothetical protein
MPVSMEFLRGVLGVIALGCVYMAARSAVAVRKGWQKVSRLYGWIIRSTLCLLAVAIRHPVDTVDLIVWALAAVLFAVGYWDASRERKIEDLSHDIVPHSEEDAEENGGKA